MPNITTFLDVNARYLKGPAFVFGRDGRTLTFPALRDAACRIAGGLASLGVQKGDRVCIYLDTSPEYLLSYFAIWRLGAVAVPTNIVYQQDELRYAIDDSGAVAVITDGNGAERVRAIRSGCRTLGNVCVVGAAADGETAWDDLAKAEPMERAANCSFDDLCQIQYTSGTTGRPKGAMLTHGNWICALATEAEVLSLVEGDVYLGIYPMGHVGLSWGLAALKAGGTFVCMDRFEPKEYLRLAEEHGATVLAAMPPVIHTLIRAKPGTEEMLGTVRCVISGGGPLLPVIWEEFDRRFKIPVVNAYGLSETIVVGSANVVLPRHYALHQGYRSVGAPVGYGEVKIVAEDDPERELQPGEIGEVALRGPSVAKGYWGMPDATAAVFRPDGWFLTGDLGYLDGESVLFITDRKKDMIIMSGWKIYPTEVENVIIEHPKIADVAIFARPDEHRGEIPVAAVVMNEGETITEEELIAYCRERLAGYKVPREVVVVEHLPRVGGWKLLRRTLREAHAAGTRD
ncbi:AMP-dependent synthetase and ligase [Methanofollis liminatans DSM 4140]|uniref:AMP-dependent synthetase and ligase n=1 Tax=Methanofollis liminatans DSM 4140 TaxID=28892 RepID=J0S757_9EURY|nr:AMP-binding protein [Methanofollis liminatans]EJG06344.1 AMP-dependent synthetase and ligase [Methanofollis liminatans DSM 4140]